MNKTDLINVMSDTTGMTKNDTRRIVDLALTIISERLAAGEKVTLSGFGTFNITEKEATSDMPVFESVGSSEECFHHGAGERPSEGYYRVGPQRVKLMLRGASGKRGVGGSHEQSSVKVGCRLGYDRHIW